MQYSFDVTSRLGGKPEKKTCLDVSTGAAQLQHGGITPYLWLGAKALGISV